MTFLINLLPIFAIFVVGYIAQLKLKFDIANLSKMSLYVLLPFLSFNTFYTHPLNIQYLYYIIYMLLFISGLILFVSLWAKFRKYTENERCALILASCFMNNGNYGTPVIFAFIAAGSDIAVIIMVLQQFIMATVGIYYAAKGSELENQLHPSTRDVWMRVLKMPVAYGALLGILFQKLNITLMPGIQNSISSIGNSSIVIIMIILGMQLARIKLDVSDWPKITFALLTRMIFSPLFATLLVLLLPLDIVSKQVLIVLAAMPSAANTTLMAVQFNTKPNLVSCSTLISTMLSLITLPIVLGIVLSF